MKISTFIGLNDLREENKMLENYIFVTKGTETVEKIKRENNCLEIKYEETTLKNSRKDFNL